MEQTNVNIISITKIAARQCDLVANVPVVIPSHIWFSAGNNMKFNLRDESGCWPAGTARFQISR
jgi:hypothetical protein